MVQNFYKSIQQHKILNIKLSKFMKNLKLFALLFCFFNILSYSNIMAYEESNYEIIKKNEVFEIRKYSDRLAVETVEHNQNSGFRKLFNYISGNKDDHTSHTSRKKWKYDNAILFTIKI